MLKMLLKDVIIKYSALLAILFILVQIAVLIFGVRPREEPVFLHYTTYLGVDFIGAWYLVYLVPLTSVIFFALNMGLIRALARKDGILKHILIIGSALISVLLLIQTILLVMINS